MSERVDLNRVRRQVSFDRLLARLFREDSPPWVLKGGYALELRFKSARSTVDIDLTVRRVAVSAGNDQSQIVREMLQTAANVPLGDWFEFTIGPPAMDLTAAPYGSARYPIEARMDERIFARFHLDAGVRDVVSPPFENVVCRDWLRFAGIQPAEVRIIAREQQFAEQIHAYTLPRNTPNSRVNDLIDLALLIGSGGLDKRRILDALHLPLREEEHTTCRQVWFHHQRIGRSRFKPWPRNAGSRTTSSRCLCESKSSSMKCEHSAQSGEAA